MIVITDLPANPSKGLASCDICDKTCTVDLPARPKDIAELREFASTHECPNRDTSQSPYRCHLKAVAA